MTGFWLAEALQFAVLGAHDLVDPADLMMVIQAKGGLAAVAFDGKKLIGYVFAFLTRTPHIQHSHRLAVLEQAQGDRRRGPALGQRRDEYQRSLCLFSSDHVIVGFDQVQCANVLGRTS